MNFGGSNIRPEATGYGLVYFTQHLLSDRMGTSIEGKRVAVSGSGNVAQFCVEKLLQQGAIPVTMSDSQGTVYEPNGFSIDALSRVMHIKAARGCLSTFALSTTGARCRTPAFSNKLPKKSCLNQAIIQT